MTDPVQETENVPESAQTLASIAQILNENPESGFEIVRAAFEAERERALTANVPKILNRLKRCA